VHILCLICNSYICDSYTSGDVSYRLLHEHSVVCLVKRDVM
jgi:hypothetical protein